MITAKRKTRKFRPSLESVEARLLLSTYVPGRTPDAIQASTFARDSQQVPHYFEIVDGNLYTNIAHGELAIFDSMGNGGSPLTGEFDVVATPFPSIDVVARGQNGHLYEFWHTESVGASSWDVTSDHGWLDLGAPASGVSFTGQVFITAPYISGFSAVDSVYAIGSDGNVYSNNTSICHQTAPIYDWAAVGTPASGQNLSAFLSTSSTTQNYVTDLGGVTHNFAIVNGDLKTWIGGGTPLSYSTYSDGSHDLTEDMAFDTTSFPSYNVFVRTTDGRIMESYFAGNQQGWIDRGKPATTTLVGRPAIVQAQPGASYEEQIFCWGADGHVWENIGNYGSTWVDYGTQGPMTVTDVSYDLNSVVTGGGWIVGYNPNMYGNRFWFQQDPNRFPQATVLLNGSDIPIVVTSYPVSAYGKGMNDWNTGFGNYTTYSGPGSDTGWRGFVWKNGILTDLNRLIATYPGLTVLGAYAIDNRGRIVADAYDTRRGVSPWDAHHGVILTPILDENYTQIGTTIASSPNSDTITSAALALPGHSAEAPGRQHGNPLPSIQHGNTHDLDVKPTKKDKSAR